MLQRFLVTTPALALLVASLPSQSVPSGFVVDTLISSGLTAPHDFCFLPDGRILVANRPGAVTLYANGGSSIIGTVPSVETGSERGLLSICADPAFPQNGYLYVWYSSTQDAFMHLDRFTCTGDLANPASTNLAFANTSRRVILANAPDSAFNHNGGSVRFGPDGRLYLSIGDDANACQAQNVATMQGVVLRMNVSGLAPGGSTIPPTALELDPGDNPLSANSDFSRLVIAYGLRNPFRMEIDPATNNLYLGDVGQNAWEEVSEYVYQQGALQLVNFGWPWREANASYSNCGGSPPTLTDPIIAISQGQGWLSVMGGPVYRAPSGQFAFGANYQGSYFYSDYFSGQIRRAVKSGNTWVNAPAVPGQPSSTNWATGFVALTSMQVGPDGALYVSQHPGTYATSNGTLKRIRPLGPVNEVVVIAGNGQKVPAGEAFPQPLVVEVRDPNGVPIPGGQVNFNLVGPGTLSTTNPVIADPNGIAQTTVTATNAGGAITVGATTPGGNPAGTSFSLFSRKISIVSTTTFAVLQVINSTSATPASVPMIVLTSAPGIPAMPTPIGPICTDPNNLLTFVLEDSIGLFGFYSLSGTGAVGTPSLVKIYNFPAGVLSGVTLQFQAVGLDPLEGPFRTNCELKTL